MSSFSSKHIGINKEQEKQMLNCLGIDSIDQLISETIPKNIRLNEGLDLDEALTENEFLNHIKKLDKKNKIINLL